MVLRVERRWVERKAQSVKEDLACFFLPAPAGNVSCASKDTICRYWPQDEKLHFIKTWRATLVYQHLYVVDT